jgi:hypothetical protein
MSRGKTMKVGKVQEGEEYFSNGNVPPFHYK